MMIWLIDVVGRPALSEPPGNRWEVFLRPQDLWICTLHWLPTLHCSSVGGVLVCEPLRCSWLTYSSWWKVCIIERLDWAIKKEREKSYCIVRLGDKERRERPWLTYVWECTGRNRQCLSAWPDTPARTVALLNDVLNHLLTYCSAPYWRNQPPVDGKSTRTPRRRTPQRKVICYVQTGGFWAVLISLNCHSLTMGKDFVLVIVWMNPCPQFGNSDFPIQLVTGLQLALLRPNLPPLPSTIYSSNTCKNRGHNLRTIAVLGRRSQERRITPLKKQAFLQATFWDGFALTAGEEP